MRPLVAERLTSKTARDGAQLPSGAVAFETEIDGGGSSSKIVPTPWPSAMPRPLGAERFTTNVSSSSSTRSPFTATPRLRDVTPGGKVRVPPVLR